MTADPFDTPAGEVDPFDLPPFDPESGELLDVVDAEIVPDGQVVHVDLATTALAAVGAVDHGKVTAFAGDLSAALDQRIGQTYGALIAARRDGPVTPEVVAPELAWLADAHEVLAAIGKVFTDQGRGVKSLMGDVVLEVRADRDLERTGGSATVKVGTAGQAGEAVKVTATQPTQTWTDAPAIVDTLVPYLMGADGDAAFAQGARAMARVLLGLDGHYGLLAAPKWKSTALETLRGELQAMPGTGVDLAARLAAGFGRKPVGNVQVEVERTTTREVRNL